MSPYSKNPNPIDDEIEEDICNIFISDIYYCEEEDNIPNQIEECCGVQLTEDDKSAIINYLSYIAMAITVKIIKNKLPKKSDKLIKKLYKSLEAVFIKFENRFSPELSVAERNELVTFQLSIVKRNVEIFREVELISMKNINITATTYLMLLTEKLFENRRFKNFDVKDPNIIAMFSAWFSSYMNEIGDKTNAVFNAAKEQHKYSLE